jgi:xylulokinase
VAELAAEIPTGSDGLLFLPASEPGQVGSLHHIQPRHTRGHMARAVLEGTVLSVRSALKGNIAKGSPVTATGKGAAIPLWCQALADALDHPVIAVAHTESAAVGAAILASVAVGSHKSLEEACKRVTKHGVTYLPRKVAAEATAALAARVEALRPAKSVAAEAGEER